MVDRSFSTESIMGYLYPGFAIVALLFASPLLPTLRGEVAQAQTIEPRKAEANRLFDQGIQQYETSQFEAALQSWQQALILYRAINDRRNMGGTLGNLGIAYQSLGNYAKAIEYQQQSLTIARELNDRRGEGQALGNLGSVYRNLGNYAKAIEYAQQDLAIQREIKNRQGEGIALSILGNTYGSLGNHVKAIEYQQQLLVIAREIKNRRSEAAALGNLGIAYQSLGNYVKAIEYVQQDLLIQREIKSRQGEGIALGILGNAYQSLGNYAKAIEYHQQLLTITRAIKTRQGEGIALNNLGYALFKVDNLVDAEKVLLEGIAVWESLRTQLGNNDTNKVSIFEQQARTYRTLQQVLVAQNKINAALEISERGRARAFVEQLSQRLQASGNRKQITIQPATLAEIQQIAKSHNAILVQYSIIYDNFKVQGKEEAQESDLYIWVIKPTGEISFRKTDLKPLWQQQNTSLEALVDQSRQAIGARSRSDAADVVVTLTPEGLRQQQEKQSRDLKQLHKLLIEPIANLLPTNSNDRGIFVPQGPLFLVPFPALQDANNQYLIEKHTLLTAPAIQVLQLTQQQRSRPRSAQALVVGNPTMPKVRTQAGGPLEQLSNLPGATTEALQIASLLNTQAITGKQATKATIVRQMSTVRIIHFATHGLLDDFQGLGVPGAIALGPDGTGQENDGLLTANDILDMKLNAELVVLSACDTGRGRLTGDGVIGLSRSLITAGVPSVLVSLWKVPDRSTALLMTEFYKNLQRNPDRATALRQAMLTTKRQHPDPIDWAAFTLIGEAE
jgi:CHAT domain-containing protein